MQAWEHYHTDRCARWHATTSGEWQDAPPCSCGLTEAVVEHVNAVAQARQTENPALYDVARRVNHEAGFPWTDPRTGITEEPPPHYRCPRCGAISFNPNDVAQRYCGRCHQFEEV